MFNRDEFVKCIFNQILDHTSTNEIQVNPSCSKIYIYKQYLDIISVFRKNKLDDRFYHQSLSSFIDNLNKNKIKTLNDYIMCYPKEIMTKFDIDSTESIGYYPNMIRNTTDEVMFISDLNKLNYRILNSLYNNELTELTIKNNFTITFRLLIPKFLFDNIKDGIYCNTKTYLSFTEDKKLKFKYDNSYIFERENIEEMNRLVNKITLNGTRHFDCIPSGVERCCYITITLSELGRLINKNYKYEEDFYDHSVLGELYYYIMNYEGIVKMMEVDANVVNKILSRVKYKG